MIKIFTFTNRKEIYKKCLYASIAHAVMSGKFDLLSDEISWDGNNYLFQNMSGVRGVISFSEDVFVCGILNEYGTFLSLDDCTDSSSDKVKRIAEEEVYPYLLLQNGKGEDEVCVSSFFYGDDNAIISCTSEADFMRNSDNIFLPYLNEFDDLKRYWNDYYESSDEQRQLIEVLFQKKEKGEKLLDEDLENKLKACFGDDWENCKNSFNEIDSL